MPEGRRYTREQIDRVVQTGEKPADLNPVARFGRNMVAGIPRTATDLYALSGLAAPFARSMWKGTEFSEEMLGQEGMEAIGQYVQSQVAQELEAIPEEWRTPENVKKIQDSIIGSEEVFNLQLEYGPASYRQGMQGSNWINKQMGLNPVHQETTFDDIGQIVGGVMMPLALPGTAARAAGGAAKRGVLNNTMRKLGEVALPGTMVHNYTPGVLGASVGIGTAINQGLRYATDQPSMLTGDAFAADQGVDVNTVAIDDGEVDQEPLDEVEVAGGMRFLDANTYAAISGVVAGTIAAMAVAAGKGNRQIVKQSIDAVTERFDATDPQIQRLDENMFGPTMTSRQRHTSELDETEGLFAPVHNLFTGADAQKRVQHLEELDYEARIGGTHSKMQHWMTDGRFLDVETIPYATLERQYSELPRAARQAADEWLASADMLDRLTAKVSSLNDQLTRANVELRALPRGDSSRGGVVSRIKAIQAERDALVKEGGDPEISIPVLREKVASGASDPQVSAYIQNYRKTADDMLRAVERDGLVTRADADRIRQTHPNYIPRQADQAGDSWGEYINNFVNKRVWGKESAGKPLFGNRLPLMNVKDGDADTIPTKITPPMEALYNYGRELIDFRQRNQMIKGYYEVFEGTPQFGRAIRELEPPMTLERARGIRGDGSSDPDAPVKRYANKPEVLSYVDNGRIRFFEVADPETARALRIDPENVLGLMNLLRRTVHATTTGFAAPWFAWTSASYSYQVGGMRLQPGRAQGMFDAAIRKAMPNNVAINAFMDKANAVDFTGRLQMYGQLFNVTGRRAQKALARKMADDLALNSGLFHHMKHVVPGGERALQNAAQAMLRQYNESMVGIADKIGITQQNWLRDPTSPLAPGMRKLKEALPRASGPARFVINRYVDMVEATHMMPRMAFFSQNYAVLASKYGGYKKIPQKEIDRLAYETKGGFDIDMTRRPGSDRIKAATRGIPYSRIAINSARQLGQHIMSDPVNSLTRLSLSYLGPKIAVVALISQHPDLRDWFWNKLPSWQRTTSLPMISPEYIIETLIEGNERPLTVDDIVLQPQTPELTLLTEPVIAGMRSLGMFGEHAQANSTFGADTLEAVSAVGGLMTPPLINLAIGGRFDLFERVTGREGFRPFQTDRNNQGFNREGITSDSPVSRWVNEAINTLFSSAGGLMVAGVEAGRQALEHSEVDAISNAFNKFTETVLYEGTRRVRPEAIRTDAVGSAVRRYGTEAMGTLYSAASERALYTQNQQGDRVRAIIDAYEPVAAQLSAERNANEQQGRAARTGGITPQLIGDPETYQLATYMHTALKTGRMNQANEEMRSLRNEMSALENGRGTMPVDRYAKARRSIIEDMHHVYEVQEAIIRNLDNDLGRRWGVSTEEAIERVGQSLQR